MGWEGNLEVGGRECVLCMQKGCTAGSPPVGSQLDGGLKGLGPGSSDPQSNFIYS